MSPKNIVLLFSFWSGCLLFLFIAQFSWLELQHSISCGKTWAQKCSPPSLWWRPCHEGSVNREGLRETDSNMVPLNTPPHEDISNHLATETCWYVVIPTVHESSSAHGNGILSVNNWGRKTGQQCRCLAAWSWAHCITTARLRTWSETSPTLRASAVIIIL